MIPEFKFTVRTKQDLIDAVERFGIVPLFPNHIQGFSVAEHVAPQAWFSGEEGVSLMQGKVVGVPLRVLVRFLPSAETLRREGSSSAFTTGKRSASTKVFLLILFHCGFVTKFPWMRRTARR